MSHDAMRSLPRVTLDVCRSVVKGLVLLRLCLQSGRRNDALSPSPAL